MQTHEILLTAFFIASVAAVIVGGLLWSVMTQHRVPGYEEFRVDRRLQVSLKLRPVDSHTASSLRHAPLSTRLTRTITSCAVWYRRRQGLFNRPGCALDTRGIDSPRVPRSRDLPNSKSKQRSRRGVVAARQRRM
jgi:hypothetical protein